MAQILRRARPLHWPVQALIAGGAAGTGGDYSATARMFPKPYRNE
jgi:hypothetical protein